MILRVVCLMLVAVSVAAKPKSAGFVEADFPFVGSALDLRERCSKAVEKGIQCILKSQINVDGKKTGWCAQHDRGSLKLRPARSYELASISGNASVGIVRFLMSIEKPDDQVIAAIQGAVRWMDGAKLKGIKLERVKDQKGQSDLVVVKDSSAPPMWARFYKIGNNEPIYCSRDGVPRKNLADIPRERRTGYRWLGYWPAPLLSDEYPAWQRKWARNKNVLAGSTK